MELGTGAPSVQGEVIDFSNIASGVLKGINIVLGITERGTEARFVQSTLDYRKYFGGEIAGTAFPYMMNNALLRGGRYWVIPVQHFTDVTDKTTLVGVKATATLSADDSDDASTVAFEATSVGPWANAGKLKVTTTAAANGDVTTVDMLVTLVGYSELSISLPSTPKNPTTDEKNAINAKLKLFCQMGAITGAGIPVGDCTFANGARTVGAIVTADYIGSASGGTGIYMADPIRDAVRIAVPEMASGALDGALAAYCDARKDLMAAVRTPLDIDADACIDYREGTGIYNHVAVNSFRAFMVTGGLVTVDNDGHEHSHAELASLLVNFSRKDTTKSSNFSAAGNKRGVIENAKDVVRDFGGASNATDFGRMYQRGINAVVKDYDDQLGNIVKFEGNRTLWKKLQLTQKLNVAEYLVWLFKMIYPIVKREGQYEPNDPQMWSALYQQIKPILKKSKEEMRAIYDWSYVGDQFATTVSDAKFNNVDDLNNGIYKFRPLIKPIAAAEWIGFEIGVTGAGVSFADVSTPNI